MLDHLLDLSMAFHSTVASFNNSLPSPWRLEEVGESICFHVDQYLVEQYSQFDQ